MCYSVFASCVLYVLLVEFHPGMSMPLSGRILFSLIGGKVSERLRLGGCERQKTVCEMGSADVLACIYFIPSF